MPDFCPSASAVHRFPQNDFLRQYRPHTQHPNTHHSRSPSSEASVRLCRRTGTFKRLTTSVRSFFVLSLFKFQIHYVSLLHPRYNHDLEGVVLSYSDERVLSHAAVVHPYFPLTRLLVQATLVVFRPLPGARLVGTVNKIADDFIGIVVLGFMNVVVRAPEVRRDLQPRPADQMWASVKNPAHTISVGDSVAFVVVEMKNKEGTFVSLTGSLERKDTGNVAVVGLVGESLKERKKKRKKGDDDDDDLIEVGVVSDRIEEERENGGAVQAAAEDDDEGIELDGKVAKKSKKKQKLKVDDGVDVVAEKGEKKKKEKQRKKKTDIDDD